MEQLNRLPIFVALTVLYVAFAFPLPVKAETWTDVTGQFKIEAEFQGVTGSSIALRKPDGTTVNVPIAKLSPASRDRAKALYEQQKSGQRIGSSASAAAASATTPKASSISISSESTGTRLSVSLPEPPTVDPLPAFPENATLQQTIDFVADQLLAGHPEVLWYMLPDEIRDAVDSEEIRGKAGSFIQQQVSAGKQSDEVMTKAIGLLVSKKDFVLNSQLMSQVPPNFAPIVAQAYDPAVGMIYELRQFSHGLEEIQHRTITEILDERGPRIGGHLKSLIALAPADLIQSIRGSAVATETDATNGTVKSMDPGGKESVTDFVRLNDRWVPKGIAEVWNQSKGDLASLLDAGIERANEQSTQSAMMAPMLVGMANSVIEPLSAASTQAEFDAALGQAMQMAGGMRPGGPAASDAPDGF